MKKEEFARQLILDELQKERGDFVTLRIIDRLVLIYGPLFDRELLDKVAENINQERRQNPVRIAGPIPQGAGGSTVEDTKTSTVTTRLATVYNH